MESSALDRATLDDLLKRFELERHPGKPHAAWRALLGAEIGDEVELNVKGYAPRVFKVLDIDTEDPGGASESGVPTA